MEEFIRLRKEIGTKNLIIQSQNRLLFELVRRLGGEVRLALTAEPLEEGWELVTEEDAATKELVMITRKAVDFNSNGANSPTI